MIPAFEKHTVGDKEKPQLNSWVSDSKTKTRARAEFIACQTHVSVEIILRTFHRQLSQKDEKRCSLHVPTKFFSEAN